MSAFVGLAVALLTSAVPLAAQNGATLGGQPVNGVCLLSRQAVFANAAVGKAAESRLQQLITEAQGQITAEQAPIEQEIAALNADTKLGKEQRTVREQALAARLQPVQLKAQQYSREIDATRAKVLERIANEAQPVIAETYQRQKCGLLLDRASVIGGNMANDLTPMVVQGLDAKISTITFNREQLPSIGQAAAPGAR